MGSAVMWKRSWLKRNCHESLLDSSQITFIFISIYNLFFISEQNDNCCLENNYAFGSRCFGQINISFLYKLTNVLDLICSSEVYRGRGWGFPYSCGDIWSSWGYKNMHTHTHSLHYTTQSIKKNSYLYLEASRRVPAGLVLVPSDREPWRLPSVRRTTAIYYSGSISPFSM